MTTPFRRVVLVVCDGLGVGAAPDAGLFSDAGSNTLGHVLAAVPAKIPNLAALGLGNLTNLSAYRYPNPKGAFGKMAEASAGKDSTTGHWELMGLVTKKAFKTYPGGFPPDLVSAFEERIGRKVLGNKAASGTDLLRELGEEHMRTGRPILYTSQDSVFQLAAHEEVVPLEELYRWCGIGYEIACLGHGVCRVIARPFVGRTKEDFRRTPNRRDFAVPPPGPTLLDRLSDAGLTVYAIGKIEDLFSRRGTTAAVHTRSDAHGLEEISAALLKVDRGLIFANLVDFDTLYGHRNDPAGYARNLEGLDAKLPQILGRLGLDDIFLLTGDHGCDPTDRSTDHTREFVPILAFGAGIAPGRDLGTRETFADLGATLAENFSLPPLPFGASFLKEIRLSA